MVGTSNGTITALPTGVTPVLGTTSVFVAKGTASHLKAGAPTTFTGGSAQAFVPTANGTTVLAGGAAKGALAGAAAGGLFGLPFTGIALAAMLLVAAGSIAAGLAFLRSGKAAGTL